MNTFVATKMILVVAAPANDIRLASSRNEEARLTKVVVQLVPQSCDFVLRY